MRNDSMPPSPSRGALIHIPTDAEWQPILHASNQVVLYNPTSHALSIRRHSSHAPPSQPPSHCPYCHRPLPHDIVPQNTSPYELEDVEASGEHRNRVANYFQLLAIANETSSRPMTPAAIADDIDAPDGPVNAGQRTSNTFNADAMADGYFKTFFQEECKLGMGANGSVYLCQHVLHGNPLGHFAVKKIAVGESHTYLLQILREVRLLERLHHPNIITYHHSWLENCQFSAFGPKVPTLHVLMQWAEGGSLDDFIEHRLGRPTRHPHLHHLHPSSFANPPSSSSAAANPTSRTARIRAFREYQRASPAERERMRKAGVVAVGGAGTWKAVHLLSAEEAKSMFGDVVGGLSFLHQRSILHLDLKPGNVLLTWDDGKLIPRAMLSDFGTSRDMMWSNQARSGNTGTLEYASPESLPCPDTGLLSEVDSKADMWSLGMILHKLLFFRLPYRYARNGGGSGGEEEEAKRMEKLEKELLTYPGFKATSKLKANLEARRLPYAFLLLLEKLLNVTPSSRPSCDKVSSAIWEGKLDPITPVAPPEEEKSSLIPIARRCESGQPGYERHYAVPTAVKEDEADVPPAPLLLRLPAPPIPRRGRLERLGLRTLKSVLLIIKVASVVPLWEKDRALVMVLMAAAVIEEWFDELWVSGLVGCVHFAVIWLVSGVYAVDR